MLKLAGYKVLACPGAGSTVEDIMAIRRAELNIVIHAELGLDLAQYLKKEYDMPYLSPLPPYGLEGSLNWLKAIGQAMPGGTQQLQAVQQEADGLNHRLSSDTWDMQRLWGEPWFERTLIGASSSVALVMAQALRSEWMSTGTLTALLHDGLPAYPVPDCIDNLLDGQRGSQVIESHLAAAMAPGLLLASGQEKAVLQQQAVTEVVCQNISLPVYDEIILHDRPFMGLRGSCHMVERL